MGKQSITRDLATFITDLSFDKLPSDVVDRAKNLILDTLATAIDGRNSPDARIALDSITGSKGLCGVWTHKLRLPAGDTAFVNSVLACYTGQQDTLYDWLHPGTIVTPVEATL